MNDLEEDDPWRERGRAVLVGLILALGVVAMVLLGRTTHEPGPERPAIAGVYSIVAECEGCDCEPQPARGLAVVHPGLPVGRPAPRTCQSPEQCAAMLARRAPPGVRAPVVLAADADPELVARELSHGPGLAPTDSGDYLVRIDRERQDANGCIRVQRTSELIADGDMWRWTETYDSGFDTTCPHIGPLACVARVVRSIRAVDR